MYVNSVNFEKYPGKNMKGPWGPISRSNLNIIGRDKRDESSISDAGQILNKIYEQS